jgi:hypothetical protein
MGINYFEYNNISAYDIMSQSDYIQLKKNITTLKSLNEFQPVLDPETYTDFAAYNLETTVSNTKNAYSRLLPTGKKYIFNIEKKVSTCPTFTLCTNTNTRANRVLNTAQKIVFLNGTTLPYKPAPTFKLNKNYIPKTCTFTNGYITRKCICSKDTCKCGTHYCSLIGKNKI